MASIRERTKANGELVYHVQVRMAGFPARTASFSTRRSAERWARAVEVEMDEGRHFRTAEARRRSLAAAIDRYVEEEIPKKRSDGHMHRGCLRWWREQIGTLKLSEITPAVLVEYRSKLARTPYTRAKPDAKRSSLDKGEKPKTYPRSNGSVNRHLSVLSHLFTVARKEWHWVTINPFDSVTKLREDKGRARFLSDDERKRLFEQTATDPTLHCLVVLALSTAARAGELLNLTWRDADLKEGRLTFHRTKNAEPRVVWIHGEALRLMQERAKVRSLTNHAVFPGAGDAPRKGGGSRRYDYAKPFADALDAAGIADFRFHDLRHSAATYLAMQGASEQQLRAIGGWKSGIVSRYVHLAATDARSAMQKLADKIDGKDAQK